MADHDADDGSAFVIPTRTLRGSRREMVADIDQAIVGLLALRHLIDDEAPTPDQLEDARRRRVGRRTRWSRLLAAVLPAGFGG